MSREEFVVFRLTNGRWRMLPRFEYAADRDEVYDRLKEEFSEPIAVTESPGRVGVNQIL